MFQSWSFKLFSNKLIQVYLFSVVEDKDNLNSSLHSNLFLSDITFPTPLKTLGNGLKSYRNVDDDYFS